MGTEVINLGGVERELARLGNKVDSLGSHVSSVESQISEVRDDLAALRNDFLTMMEEQRRASALEQAATELVSVRQEMERKFGNYGVVRNTMVGILQATDAALVRKATISTVSEELMISTPDYWLAPVLVALAAWINNNRDPGRARHYRGRASRQRAFLPGHGTNLQKKPSYRHVLRVACSVLLDAECCQDRHGLHGLHRRLRQRNLWTRREAPLRRLHDSLDRSDPEPDPTV